MKLKSILIFVIIALFLPRTVDAFLFRKIFQTLFGWLFCPLFGLLCSNPCNRNSCMNGGVCSSSGGTESIDMFQCNCTGTDYLGVTCSEIPLDVPLVDGGMVFQNLSTSTFNANVDMIEIKLIGSTFLLNYTEGIVFLVNNETVFS